MKRVESLCSTTRAGSTGCVKLGQPVPESNLSVELKSGSPVRDVDVETGLVIVPELVSEGRLGRRVLGDLVLEPGERLRRAASGAGFAYCLFDMTFVLFTCAGGGPGAVAPTFDNSSRAKPARPRSTGHTAVSGDRSREATRPSSYHEMPVMAGRMRASACGKLGTDCSAAQARQESGFRRCRPRRGS